MLPSWKKPLAGWLSVAATIGITSCVVLRSLDVRMWLRPRPPLACVATTLADSPDVARVESQGTEGGREGFWLALRDSTAAHGQRFAALSRAIPPDSGEVVVLKMHWQGTRRPPVADEQRAITLAGRILEQIRRACAPDSPRMIECVYDDGERPAECAAPAV